MKSSTALVWGVGAVVLLAAGVAATHEFSVKSELELARLNALCTSEEMHRNLMIYSSGTVGDSRIAQTDAFMKEHLQEFLGKRRDIAKEGADPAVYERWVKLDRLISENVDGFQGLEGDKLEQAVADFGKQRCLKS